MTAVRYSAAVVTDSIDSEATFLGSRQDDAGASVTESDKKSQNTNSLVLGFVNRSGHFFSFFFQTVTNWDELDVHSYSITE